MTTGDCGSVKLGDARFVSVASPEVLNMANGVDDVDDQFASFLLDSGAAAHCCFEKARFKAIRYGHFGCVKVANGILVPIMACGDVDVDIGGQVITLKNVMYVPDLKFNVISVKKLWKDNRIETTFGDRCYLKDTTHGNKRYYFPGQNGSLYKVGVVSTAKIPESLLHRRLGHCGINKLRTAKLLCNGLPETDPKQPHNPSNCEACLRGGATKQSFNTTDKQSFYVEERNMMVPSNWMPWNETDVSSLVRRSVPIFADLSQSLSRSVINMQLCFTTQQARPLLRII